ncbi:MAG: aldehyde dehydrogenase family protein, partial [Cytophagales bacterium]|nr:aldehyde dehydrogenase family protein [Cytophagales bacterium]
SELVAGAIKKAIDKAGMPKGVFQHLHGIGFEVGQALVKHPLTKAVGFTGSLAGGKALFDIACQRAQPIPVFAEMSSINPVILLPDSLVHQAERTAAALVGSITQGVGQFCTNPGLLVAIENDGLNRFIKSLSEGINNALPGIMLHQGIADNYTKRLARTLEQKGVTVEGQSSSNATESQGKPLVASVLASTFLKNPLLAEEVFGPFSLIVKCKGIHELHAVANHLSGQLTTSIFGDEVEIAKYSSLVNVLIEKAGRLIVNGVPTGVEVCPSMNHGGPFPATTDSRFTAVGIDAIKRFARPVAFQSFPNSLLPEELQDGNPLGIWRLFNNEWKK